MKYRGRYGILIFRNRSCDRLPEERHRGVGFLTQRPEDRTERVSLGKQKNSQVWSITRSWSGEPLAGYPGSSVRVVVTPEGIEVHFDGPLMPGQPPPHKPGRLWGLWNYDVLECFIVGPGQTYIELEVGPHGHYLALKLDGPRQITDDNVPVEVEWTEVSNGRWSACMRVARRHLPQRPWRINAFAVHGREPRQYLAATPVAGDHPDFHRIHLFEQSELN
jgi:hypothetical protein